MGNPFDNYDYESEFNYLMEMFDHPYKEMNGQYIVIKHQESDDITKYDLGTFEGMQKYYFEMCCLGEDYDLTQRVGDFLEIFVKTTTYQVFEHIRNSIVWDLQHEMDEIKGATDN